MADPTDADSGPPEAVGDPKGRAAKGGRIRRLGVTVLVVLSCISFLSATLGYWANRNLLKTEVWVDRVGPLAKDLAVQQALTDRITDEVMRLIKPEDLFAEALPEKGQILAVPLANVVETFVHDQVADIVSSEKFQTLWVAINRIGHSDAVAVLRGESPSKLVEVSSGQVLVNIIPVINQVLERISEVSPEIFGREVTIPKITVGDLPDEARDKIATALGVEVPDNFGVITVYDGDALSSGQTALKLFDKGLAGSILLTLILAPLAIVLSRRRRRTALQLLVGFSLVLVLIRRVVLRLVTDVVDLAQIPGNQEALGRILHAFADPLLNTTGWVLAGFVAVIAVLGLTGPYRWARALRSGVTGVAKGTATSAAGLAQRDTTTAWVAANSTALQGVSAAVFVAGLWWWDLSWLGLLALAAVVGGFVLWVSRVAEAHRTESAAD